MRSELRLCSAALVVVASMVTACGTAEVPSEPPPVAAPIVVQPPYTTIWSADPGVDLLARSGELVRGTMEAGHLSRLAGASASFPGFSDALRGQVDDVFGRDDAVENPDMQYFTVTHFAHITDFVADDTSISALVCGYTMPKDPDSDDDNRFRVLAEKYRIVLRNAGDGVGMPGVADNDVDGADVRSEPVPDWDVFGSWRIDVFEAGRKEKSEHEFQGCVDWWLAEFPSFVEGPEGNAVFPPVGFERPSAPVGQQYPEWIGPADAE